MKSISVVLPNYNGASLLKENLPYVYEALRSSSIGDFEVIVADDASTDDSIVFLEQHYSEIKIIKNTKNKGFSSNVNSGIFAAEKELVLILNTDVKLSDDYFIPLLPYFEHADTFGVTGRIMSMDASKIQDGAKFPSVSFGSIIATKNYISDQRQCLYSLFLSGANALVDRKKLLEIRAFNTLFDPYYFEDVDLGLTAWQMGYKLYYVHDVVCYHPNSATINKQPSLKVKRIAKRNKLLLHYLHLNTFAWTYFIVLFILKMCGRMLIFDMFYYKVLRDFLSIRREAQARRTRFKHIRKQTLGDMKKTILTDIRGLEIVKF